MTITLETLHKATAQEVYDQVARHLLTQMQRSGVGTRCYYRYEGLKCAAGCLIADHEYRSVMEIPETNSWEALVNNKYVPTNCHSQLIRRLQVIHDSIPPELWKDSLTNIAIEFILNTDVLEEF